MLRNKLKKLACIALASLCLASMGTTAFAGTIPFNVTVGGSGTQDPLSMKENKSADGDQYAYFTGTWFSTTNGIYVRSYKKSDTTLYSSRAYLSSGNVGSTIKCRYNKHADGGVPYFMKATPASGRVKAKGNYCP